MSVFWWVELDFSSLACNEVPSSEFGVLAWLWAHCLLMLRVVFLLYCEGHPERVISHIEMRRGRQEIEVTKRGRGERNLASNQFSKCSPQSKTPRKIHRVT